MELSTDYDDTDKCKGRFVKTGLRSLVSYVILDDMEQLEPPAAERASGIG
jgi:hypothetical protein